MTFCIDVVSRNINVVIKYHVMQRYGDNLSLEV